MKQILFALIVSLFFASSAYAGDPISDTPITGHGWYPFGMTRAEVKERHPDLAWLEGRELWWSQETKVVGYSGIVAFWFTEDDSLNGINFIFAPEKVSSVILYELWSAFKKRLVKKYGEPNGIIESMYYPYDDDDIYKHLETALGNGNATFTGKWKDKVGNVVEIQLEETGIQVKYFTKEVMDEIKRKAKKEDEDW